MLYAFTVGFQKVLRVSFISRGSTRFNWHSSTVASLKVPPMIVYDMVMNELDTTLPTGKKFWHCRSKNAQIKISRFFTLVWLFHSCIFNFSQSILHRIVGLCIPIAKLSTRETFYLEGSSVFFNTHICMYLLIIVFPNRDLLLFIKVLPPTWSLRLVFEIPYPVPTLCSANSSKDLPRPPQSFSDIINTICK